VSKRANPRGIRRIIALPQAPPRNEYVAMAAAPVPPAPEDFWRHRSEGMRCQTCIFFVLKANTLGRCRRHAPTLSGWPAVFKQDWCGDHKLDETKL
jgi:hypothetical protein